MYTIETGRPDRRLAVSDWLTGLGDLRAETREAIITAWVTTWCSSSFAELADMPYSGLAPAYQLAMHVNEVTRTGLDLLHRAEAEWGLQLDMDQMLAILILHDVDKPLLYERRDGIMRSSRLAAEMPHGVIGAMLLKQLGLPPLVVSTVALHASNAPFHGSTPEAYILHYADFFSSDHAIMLAGTKPFFQRHWMP